VNIQEAARVALDCPDACNLSGVLASFKEIVHDVLWPEARRLGKGTEWVNQHPICTLFLSKLASLNGSKCFCSESTSAYTRAATQVHQLAAASKVVG
jgi:hypothetical protein